MNDHLHPLMQAALMLAEEEANRIAFDVRYNQMKDSGELHRRETDRAHREELAAGVHA